MQTGWLAPNGDFYPCEVYDHVEVAREIIDKLNVPRDGRYHSDDILWSSGWVKITRFFLGVKEQGIVWDKFLTEYQKQFLRPYFEENDELVSFASKARWDREMDLN
jgi:hypothetical protein